MISLGEDYVLSWNGALVFASIALTIVGCSLLGFAGKKKDENLKKKREGKILNANPENNYTSYFVNEYSSLRGIYHAPQVATKTTKIPTYIGVLLAFVAGVLSSNQNLGTKFSFAKIWFVDVFIFRTDARSTYDRCIRK
jgi:hypothetical protein